jgi:UDP:flavonoid glycosyltransferase YjiC (YdhE family)
MKNRHVAFCLDQAYGNIIPTVGIALELMERDYRVSYTVAESFAPIIRKIGATPLVIAPLDIRGKIHSVIVMENDCFKYDLEKLDYCTQLSAQRTAHLLPQLEQLFVDCRPDLIIHDDSLDKAGRDLAIKWGIARIRHHSQFIDEDFGSLIFDEFNQDQLILMTVPEFLQRDRSVLDARFEFVGFIPRGRGAFFEPWTPASTGSKPILISATTGLLPQREFYKVMIEAVRHQPWDVIVSISGSRDPISAISSAEIGDLPANINLNSHASNFEILQHASLYVGQGGQGGSLESMFWGVPQIVAAPDPYHHSVARRVSELKLGYSLLPTDLSVETLREKIFDLSSDREVLDRTRIVGEEMRRHDGAALAVDIIERHLSDHVH